MDLCLEAGASLEHDENMIVQFRKVDWHSDSMGHTPLTNGQSSLAGGESAFFLQIILMTRLENN